MSENNDPEKQDELMENADVVRTVQEDPVLAFFIKWKKQFLSLVVVVLASFFLVDRYNEKKQEAMSRAADIFSGTRDDLTALKGVLEKTEALEEGEEVDAAKAEELNQEIEQIRERMGSKLRILQEETAPYSQLAELYSLIEAIEGEQFDKADELLAESGWNNFQALDSEAKFWTELAGLYAGRSFLDIEGKEAKGIEMLQVVADQGEYAAVSAAVALVRISDTPEEKEKALKTVKDLIARDPVQQAQLQEELGMEF